jgi:hypothetical protein
MPRFKKNNEIVYSAEYNGYAEVYTIHGEKVTATASASATSTVSYIDAFSIAKKLANSIALSKAQIEADKLLNTTMNESKINDNENKNSLKIENDKHDVLSFKIKNKINISSEKPNYENEISKLYKKIETKHLKQEINQQKEEVKNEKIDFNYNEKNSDTYIYCKNYHDVKYENSIYTYHDDYIVYNHEDKYVEENILDIEEQNILGNVEQNVLDIEEQNILGNVEQNVLENGEENILGNVEQNVLENGEENILGNVEQNVLENGEENILDIEEQNILENVEQNILENGEKNILDIEEQNILENEEENILENVEQNILENEEQNILENGEQNVLENGEENILDIEEQNILGNVEQNILENEEENILENKEEYTIEENYYETNVCYRGESSIENNEYIEIELPNNERISNFTVYITPLCKQFYYVNKVKNNKFKVFGKNGNFNWIAFGKLIQ